MRISKGGEDLSNTANPDIVNDKVKHSDQFSAAEIPERLNTREYGSVTGILEDLISLEKQLLQPRFLTSPTLSKSRKNQNNAAYKANLEDETHRGSTATVKPIIINSDDEDHHHRSLPIFGTLLPKSDEENDINDTAMAQTSEGCVQINEVNRQAAEMQFTKSTGVCAMVQEEDQRIKKEDDCLDDMVTLTSESSELRSMVNRRAAEIKSRKNKNNAACKLENVEDETHGGSTATVEVIVIDSDDEDPGQTSLPIFGALLPKTDDITMTQTPEGCGQRKEVSRQAAEIQFTKSTGVCAMVKEEDQRIERKDDCLVDTVPQTSESVLRSKANGRAAAIKMAQVSKGSVQKNEVNGQAAEIEGVCAIIKEEDQIIEEEDDHLDDIVTQTSDSSVLRSLVNDRAADIKVLCGPSVYEVLVRYKCKPDSRQFTF